LTTTVFSVVPPQATRVRQAKTTTITSRMNCSHQCYSTNALGSETFLSRALALPHSKGPVGLNSRNIILDI
jgi:hypothetical protein